MFLPCAVFGDCMFLGIYFLLVVRFIGILWFIVICHISWYFCGISCNLTFFISDFMWLVFFLMSLTKGYKFCFFLKNQLFFPLSLFFQSLFHSFPLLSLWFLLTFVVPSLSHVRLSAAPWTATCQASLSFTISLSLLKLMPIEWMMPSNHLIPCCLLLLLPSIFPSIKVFSNELALLIR